MNWAAFGIWGFAAPPRLPTVEPSRPAQELLPAGGRSAAEAEDEDEDVPALSAATETSAEGLFAAGRPAWSPVGRGWTPSTAAAKSIWAAISAGMVRFPTWPCGGLAAAGPRG